MDSHSRVTRRRLIGTAAAGVAVTALPSTAAFGRSRLKADVVVVGGGLAGLTAARALEKQHRSVTVLEARGWPTGSTAPDTLARLGAVLRAPNGRIHWAGTETADYWAGYMDGAVRSGERAAKEVLRAL
jgi:monoamine oxidase